MHLQEGKKITCVKANTGGAIYKKAAYMRCLLLCKTENDPKKQKTAGAICDCALLQGKK